MQFLSISYFLFIWQVQAHLGRPQGLEFGGGDKQKEKNETSLLFEMKTFPHTTCITYPTLEVSVRDLEFIAEEVEKDDRGDVTGVDALTLLLLLLPATRAAVERKERAAAEGTERLAIMVKARNKKQSINAMQCYNEFEEGGRTFLLTCGDEEKLWASLPWSWP